jgi:hypothetical protein
VFLKSLRDFKNTTSILLRGPHQCKRFFYVQGLLPGGF